MFNYFDFILESLRGRLTSVDIRVLLQRFQFSWCKQCDTVIKLLLFFKIARVILPCQQGWKSLDII